MEPRPQLVHTWTKVFLLAVFIAGTFWPTTAALGSRGEAFWLLFPMWVLDRVSIPIHFFHGSEDTIVPPDCTQRLFDAYHGPKKLRVQQGAGHGGAAAANPSRYGREVREFFIEAAN